MSTGVQFNMNDTANVVSAIAITILLVFLFRFYRKQVAPGLQRGQVGQTLFGLAVIIASILLSIWWRKNS